MGVFGRVREGLRRTAQQLFGRFDEIARRADAPERRTGKVDAETAGALEELLITADVGVAAADRIVSAVQARARHGESLRELVKDELLAILDGTGAAPPPSGAPTVVMVVGVNGTGKTTTVAKLAHLYKSQGDRPLVCAADTFRAAAVEQLEIVVRQAVASRQRVRFAPRRIEERLQGRVLAVLERDVLDHFAPRLGDHREDPCHLRTPVAGPAPPAGGAGRRRRRSSATAPAIDSAQTSGS